MFDTFHPRYLIPNAITALSLLLAFTSIVEASRGNFESAAWLIVWCVLLDIADGKVAGWVNARSSFGIQFDSLADLLAFCAAPATLVYFVLTIDPRHAPFFENGITLIGLHGSVGCISCAVRYDLLVTIFRPKKLDMTSSADFQPRFPVQSCLHICWPRGDGISPVKSY